MIIEDKSSQGLRFSFNDRSIIAIQEDGDLTRVYFYGIPTPVLLHKKYEEFKKAFIDAQDRDPYTDKTSAKYQIDSFPEITIGEFKFFLQSVKSEYDQETRSHLKLVANFPVKNDIIKLLVEEVPGVESYNEYGFNKYECTISIGKLFDPKSLIPQIEEKIKTCLQ
jgi:hypothetical protein